MAHSCSCRRGGKLLQGARPETMPVDMVAKVETHLNGKALGSLGISIPQSLKPRVNRIVDP